MGKVDVATRRWIGGAAIALAVACGSSNDSSRIGSDDAGTDQPDAGRSRPTTDASPSADGPPAPPTSIAFRDRDLTEGRVLGAVLLGMAADETNVASYELYWAAGPSSLLSRIHEVPRTGSHLEIGVSGSIPPAATHIVAFAVNAKGDRSTPLAVGPVDDEVMYADVSAGQAAGRGSSPTALVDEAAKKLLVVATDTKAGSIPVLFRCELGGTGCAFHDLSAGQPAPCGSEPRAILDAAAAKLLVVTSNGANGNRASLFRCDLDGANCVHTDVSAGQGATSGLRPDVALDAKNGKLLVVTTNGANEHRPALFRCERDGSGCTYVDISAGQGLESGYQPSVQIDTANDKLLVVTLGNTAGAPPSLFRCNLDGSGCTYRSMVAGSVPFAPTSAPATAIEGGKLFTVFTDGVMDNRATLILCNVDGTACARKDVSGGQGPRSGEDPSIVVDASRGTLFVATAKGQVNATSSLVRCDLDGSRCTNAFFPAGEPENSGHSPSAVLDEVSRKLRVVSTKKSGYDGVPAMYSIGLH